MGLYYCTALHFDMIFSLHCAWNVKISLCLEDSHISCMLPLSAVTVIWDGETGTAAEGITMPRARTWDHTVVPLQATRGFPQVIFIKKTQFVCHSDDLYQLPNTMGTVSK